MATIVLVIHLLLAIGLVGVVLAQRSEAGLGSLGGGGGGGGGMGGLLGNRTTANLLTRTTAILAACFMTTSILLAILAGSDSPRAIVEETPSATESQVPAVPAGPVVPKSQ
jgi:preprotein translocase subunit SecG